MGQFAAVVLAGGAARRMGGTAKPTRAVGGVPLLSRVLDAVRDANPRVVVGPSRLRVLVPEDVVLTAEEPPGGGPVAAAGAGLEVLGTTAQDVALLAGDLPFLSVSTVRALRRAMGGVDGAVLVDDAGRAQWLCGVWRAASLRSRLEVLGEPRGRGMGEFVDGLRVVHVRAPHPGGPPAWFDCDTEDDLRRAEEWAHGDVGRVE